MNSIDDTISSTNSNIVLWYKNITIDVSSLVLHVMYLQFASRPRWDQFLANLQLLETTAPLGAAADAKRSE